MAKQHSELEFDKVFSLEHIFPTNHDAVCRALLQTQNQQQTSTV